MWAISVYLRVNRFGFLHTEHLYLLLEECSLMWTFKDFSFEYILPHVLHGSLEFASAIFWRESIIWFRFLPH